MIGFPPFSFQIIKYLTHLLSYWIRNDLFIFFNFALLSSYFTLVKSIWFKTLKEKKGKKRKWKGKKGKRNKKYCEKVELHQISFTWSSVLECLNINKKSPEKINNLSKHPINRHTWQEKYQMNRGSECDVWHSWVRFNRHLLPREGRYKKCTRCAQFGAALFAVILFSRKSLPVGTHTLSSM